MCDCEEIPQNPSEPCNCPPGLPGTSINWLGEFVSAPTAPNLNEAYYNSTLKRSFIWDGNAWQIVSIDGISGDLGNEGPQGPQGPQGIPGIQGIPGLKGATGPQGIQGIQGVQGVDGVDGTNGIDGINGSDIFPIMFIGLGSILFNLKEEF